MPAASDTFPSLLPVSAGVSRTGSALTRPIARSSLVIGLMILGLNLVDAFATLRHVAVGAEELNPLMARLLEVGPITFLLGKHLLASAGVVGILAQGEVRAARIVLRYLLLPVYLLVAAYQALLFILV